MIVGWKQIGAYLQRTDRRARDLVALGLPVRRVGGVVEAEEAELRAWLAACPSVEVPPHRGPRRAAPEGQGRLPWAA